MHGIAPCNVRKAFWCSAAQQLAHHLFAATAFRILTVCSNDDAPHCTRTRRQIKPPVAHVPSAWSLQARNVCCGEWGHGYRALWTDSRAWRCRTSPTIFVWPRTEAYRDLVWDAAARRMAPI